MDWDWTSILKTAVGAGVGSAVVTLLVQGLLPIYREYRQRQKHATYMAMRLAVMLENFAWACANLIQDNHNAQTPPDEEYPAWDVSLPEIGSYPDDGDGWRAIDRELAGRCLELRNRLEESQGLIRNVIEFTEDELGEMLDLQIAKRGLEAWEIASALRRRHGVGATEPEWNYADYLLSTFKRAEKTIQENREKRAKDNSW